MLPPPHSPVPFPPPPSPPPSPRPTPPPLPPPIPPPPAEDCSAVCLYVQTDLREPIPSFIHPLIPSALDGMSRLPEVFVYPYPETPTSSHIAAATAPNGLRGVSTHPSDLIIGSDGQTAAEAAASHHPALVFRDSYRVLGVALDEANTANVTMVASASSSGMHAPEPQLAVGAHVNIGMLYTTCEWLRHCDAQLGERLGSACAIQQHGLTLRGFCFQNGMGDSLECGRALRVDRGTPSTARQVSDVPRRCPRGIALDAGGGAAQMRVRRLPVGGCLLSRDLRYDPLADVHVATACSVPRDHPRKGCMLFGALNFDASARQNARCTWAALGCTSSTALNYRSDASADDGSCIEPSYGCTLPAMHFPGVADGDTPSGGKGGGGQGGKGGGGAWSPPPPLPMVQAVLNAAHGANTLGTSSLGRLPGHLACVLVIEGCMNSSAVNYDPLATVTQSTWCVPRVVGCMLPLPSAFHPDGSGVATVAGGGVAGGVATGAARQPLPPSFLWLYGGSANYDSTATVHNINRCRAAIPGCTLSVAINYDPRATLDDGRCFPNTAGCFNRSALNFNCTTYGPEQPCTADRPRATFHAPRLCRFSRDSADVTWAAFAAARPSTLAQTALADAPLPECRAAACIVVTSVEVGMWAQGEPADVDVSAVQAIFGTLTGRLASAPPEVYVLPGSVLLLTRIQTRRAAALTATLAPHLSDSASASALLGLAIISTPVLVTVHTQIEVPPEPLAQLTFAEEWYGSLTIVLVALIVLTAVAVAVLWRAANRNGQGVFEFILEQSDNAREALRTLRNSLRERAISPRRVDVSKRMSVSRVVVAPPHAQAELTTSEARLWNPSAEHRASPPPQPQPAGGPAGTSVAIKRADGSHLLSLNYVGRAPEDKEEAKDAEAGSDSEEGVRARTEAPS